ncbi:MAG: ShlB/FhaC/HecB family hemolysin secretion/activation protein [Verrucomicrobiales bacterium]|nr:ShlB/FhaC/HecB family hemolysin secretion/activation protein [Verrucomicrobiales bacterium]
MRIALLLSLFLISGTNGQDKLLDRFKPRELPSPLTTATPDESPDAADETSPTANPAEEATGISLRGIVLLNSPDGFNPDGGPSVDGVVSDALPLVNNDKFRASLTPFIGRPLTFSMVQSIAFDIARWYNDHDLPVVSVIAPEQDITNGVVHFVVTEAHLGKVEIVGNRWFKSELFTPRIEPGDPIILSTLEADAAFLSRNPFHSVMMSMEPGADTGETDVSLIVNDKFPFRVFAGYEDSGVQSTGEHRLYGGFNWGNVGGLDHQLNYQYLTDTDFERVMAHSAVYTVPLPWRHLLTFTGTYAESEPVLGGLFDLSGESWQLGSRYIIPLRKLGKIKHEVAIGYDFKFTNNNLLFGGVQVFDTPVEVSQFSLGYLASLPDRWGSTTFSANGFWSPGGMGSHNNDVDFNAARVGSDSDYVYATLGLDRITRLPFDFTLATSANGQLSAGNLQATEQFLLGGYSTVRGYDELVATGDRGFLLRNEIYTRAISLLQLAGLKSVNDQLQFLAFYDFGVAELADPLPGEGKNIELQSAGLGLRWQIATNASIRFDYGWQLEDIGLPDSSRAHVGVTVSY